MDVRNILNTGLSVIFDPEGQPLVDIVFVHGIQGHPWCQAKKKCRLRKWARRMFRPKTIVDEDHADSQQNETPSSPACYWPKDLLPLDLPRSRILTWGYDSMVTRGLQPTDKSSLFTHAKNFAFALGRVAVASRPIIFIAHSLGGIVIKEMLAHCDGSENVKHQDIAASTAAIMFFGTPHRGSQDAAGYAEVARKAASILLDTNPALLDSLGLRTSDLERSQDAFVKLWRKHGFRVKTFQESTGLSAVKIGVFHQKVVPDFSSRLDDPREEAETLPWKPYGHRPGYIQLRPEVCGNYWRVTFLALVGQLPLSTIPRNNRKVTTFPEILLENQMRNHEKGINQPQRGTCIWLKQNPVFRQWFEDEKPLDHHGVLWIRGKPGSGKSTLIKATSQDPRLRSFIVASYYFNAGSTSKLQNSELGMYRSLLYQILERNDLCVRGCFFESDIGRQYTGVYTTKETEDWTVATLKSLLGKLLSESPSPHKPAIFFIDAMDECADYEARSILAHLYDLVDMNVLRLCISSRSSFGNIPPKCLVVTMDDYNRSDISAYVTQTFSYSGISTDPRAESLGVEITTRSQGVFLWAILITRLVIRHHEVGENWDSITTRLSEVPPELSGLYEQLLADIPATEDALVTYQFFVWVLLSGQSLRMREWCHILPFLHENRPRSLGIMAGSIETDMQLERKIRSISRGLVEVRHEAENYSFPGGSTSVDTDSIRADAGSLRNDLGETRPVQIIHGSVSRFFLEGRGLMMLILARNTYLITRNGMDSSALDLPHEPPSYSELAECHYNIMSTCLAYLNVPELDRWVEARKLVMRRKGKQTLGRHSPGRHFPERYPPATRYSSSNSPSEQDGARKIDPVAAFISAGSTPPQQYRSSYSSDLQQHFVLPEFPLDVEHWAF
ncbi:hypothetical protein PG984_011410 [Apiospora sp. TS-2023a]